VIDAGFLELTRLGELPASDPDVLRSLKVVDSVIGSPTSSGPGWHRYGIEASDATVVVSAMAGADGHFRITVPLRPGPNVITAAVARGTHATGWAQVTVKG
jgi:hypothetical protein